MKKIKLFIVLACSAAYVASASNVQANCCDDAKKAGKTCEHKCCIAAAKAKKNCEKCNPKPKDEKK